MLAGYPGKDLKLTDTNSVLHVCVQTLTCAHFSMSCLFLLVSIFYKLESSILILCEHAKNSVIEILGNFCGIARDYKILKIAWLIFQKLIKIPFIYILTNLK